VNDHSFKNVLHQVLDVYPIKRFYFETEQILIVRRQNRSQCDLRCRKFDRDIIFVQRV